MSTDLDAARLRLLAFCREHRLTLSERGECGFSRPCVGLLAPGGHWLAFAPRIAPDYGHDAPGFPDDERLRAPNDVDAYHKHDCFAVLVTGDDYDAALRGLDRWVTHLLTHGAVEVAEYETGATGLQAMLSGVTGYALRFTDPDPKGAAR